MIRIFLFGIFLFTCFQISSQTCCSGGIPLSNNLGLPNDGKGSFLIGLNYDYNNLNTLNAGSNKLSDDSRLRITNSVLLNAGYAFTDRFSFEGLFTWIHQKRTITQFGNENLSETQGVGDAVFLLNEEADLHKAHNQQRASLPHLISSRQSCLHTIGPQSHTYQDQNSCMHAR